MYSWNPLPHCCPPGLASCLLKGADITHLSISSAVYIFFIVKQEDFLAFKLF